MVSSLFEKTSNFWITFSKYDSSLIKSCKNVYFDLQSQQFFSYGHAIFNERKEVQIQRKLQGLWL